MKIAVIGAGVAGLGAAWLLSRKHDVVVYERADRVGGLLRWRHSRGLDRRRRCCGSWRCRCESA